MHSSMLSLAVLLLAPSLSADLSSGDRLSAMPVRADVAMWASDEFTSDLAENRDDLSLALRNLKAKIDAAQRAAEDAASTDIDAARNRVREQMKTMREILDKFAPDAPLTNSFNKLENWISSNRARIFQSQGLNEQQKAYLLGQWDQYVGQMDQSRRQYEALARTLSQKLDNLSRDDNFVGEKLLLQLADEALSAIRSMMREMKTTIDAIDMQNNAIAVPKTPSS